LTAWRLKPPDQLRQRLNERLARFDRNIVARAVCEADLKLGMGNEQGA
jgi:hypothetical protein